MARKRALPNFLYATLGLAVVGTAGYYAIRAVRRRRAEGEGTAMMELRRSKRAGRHKEPSEKAIAGEAETSASGLEFAATKSTYSRV